MGQETMGKKDREKKKKLKKQQKEERRLERKENNDKGKSLDSMMAYIDENGNLSDTPPDPRKMKEMKAEDIQLGAAPIIPTDPADLIRKGVVKFFNHDKGFGFINDLQSQDSIFVHINELDEPVNEQDKVTFEVEKGPKGLVAVRVKKVK
ncbi:MAG: cold shock domain-containing protein [Chitinophagales bacterium]|nr:cold shock domain-containing protein [Chitinophagales bacterium]